MYTVYFKEDYLEEYDTVEECESRIKEELIENWGGEEEKRIDDFSYIGENTKTVYDD